ncbi:MAG: ExbD/TolR family protein [Desulfovibrionaceae bacterium]|nr:ExbD/TolR family protein [Desulfovibrionaceae bacterium]
METPGRRNSNFVSQINVTPFVDVMLVLLIIFMITAPMMTQGLDVDLPTTQAVDSLPSDTPAVTMTIKADNTIWLDQYQVDSLENLSAMLEENVIKPNKTLFIQADKNVNYGVVVDMMGRIKLAGIENVGLVADHVEPALPEVSPESKDEK